MTPADVRISLLNHLTLNREAYAKRLSSEPGLLVTVGFSGLTELLDADVEVLGDIAVISYALSPGSVDGIAMIRKLRLCRPRLPLLVLTPAASPGMTRMAMRAGAQGVVSTTRAWQDIVAAIRSAARGHAVILRDFLPMAQGARRPGSTAEALMILDHPWLTEHEREVLRCCLTGLSVGQTAQKLGRSAHTISTQKRGAFNKLSIESDFQLFALIRSS